MKKHFLMGLLTATMVMSASAGEVSTGYNDVAPNQPATANDINANFGALISAINDNAQRIAALEDQAAGIDTGAGSYTLIETAVELVGNTGTGLFDGYSQVGTFANSGSFSLLEDGSFSGAINENFSFLFDDRLCDNEGTAEEQCRQAYQPNFNNTAPTENLAGTWTEDSNAVYLTLGSDTLTFFKAGPRLLIYQEKSQDVASSSDTLDYTNLVFLFKQLN